jgi:hypothetical protein
MTRGRRAYTAVGDAVRIAEKRGEVRQFRYEPAMVCNFVIYMLCSVAHVRIKRICRIRCPHAIIEREASEDLAILRSIAYVAGISRELWVYSPRGSFRIFRVTDTGLIELGHDGLLLPVPVAEKTGTIPPAQNPVPSAHPDPAVITVVSVGEKVLPEGGGGEQSTP